MNEKLKAKLDILPLQPGCYIFKDADQNILYVGKAKKLKNRVLQYFNRAYNNKTAKLVQQIDDLEFFVTLSEKEALVLEINLIKQYYPPFNVIFKDDKHYPYIAISKEKNPRLKITRDAKSKSYKHYGPFPDSKAAYNTMHLLNAIYPLRKCQVVPKNVCLYYHMKQCLAPCIHDVKQQDYQQIVNEIDKFFKGNTKDILQDLTQKMHQASDALEFEKANEYKQLIQQIHAVTDKQVIEFNDQVNRDIIGFYQKEGYLSITILMYRNGYLNAKINEVIDILDTIEEPLLDYLMQFYQTHDIPKEIYISNGIHLDLLEETLMVKVIYPKAAKGLDLILIAVENAKKSLEEKFVSLALKDEDIFIELGKYFNKERISTIEMCDISHISGDSAVGGVVVFTNGYPIKNKYRKFIIKGENKQDDLASTYEVIYRRFYNLLKDNLPFSDLLIVDGGVNQMKAAMNALQTLGITLDVCGLAKDQHHHTRALILPNFKEVELAKNSKLFLFLMRLQDEVHRYAITFFKAKKAKSMFSSLFDQVEGLGPARKKRLLELYPTLEELKKCSIEQLSQILPLNVAKNLQKVLNNTNHLKNNAYDDSEANGG